jgi:four helix bundle protein
MTPAELRHRASNFANRVAAFARPLLRSPESKQAALQLRRAASSVGSNHRAAGVARSHAEFTSKIGIVLEEADESLYWLEYLRSNQMASGPELTDLTQEARELTKIFAASARTARAKERQSQPAKPRRRTRTTAQDPSMTDDR